MPSRQTLHRPLRTPTFRVQHPITGNEYVLHLARTRVGGTIHAVFDPKSPTAQGVRRIIHNKRRGYFDFLQAASSLLAMVRWHDPRPYFRRKGEPLVHNPDHYAEWDIEHQDYPQKGTYIGVIVLYVEQLADPLRGRGRKLAHTLDVVREAQLEMQTTGAVTAVSKARANLRARMLDTVTKALQTIAPLHAQFKQSYHGTRRRGPTALGYTRDEIDHLRQLWTGAYFALSQIQIRVRDNALHMPEESGPRILPPLTPPDTPTPQFQLTDDTYPEETTP